MSCALCGRTIHPGRPRYLVLDMTICVHCPFSRGQEVHDLAAPTCTRAHDVWRHPRALVLRRSTP